MSLTSRLNRWLFRPRPEGKTVLPPWMYYGFIIVGLALASLFPLLWRENGTFGKDPDNLHFRHDIGSEIIFGAMSLVGLVGALVWCAVWIKAIRTARRNPGQPL